MLLKIRENKKMPFALSRKEYFKRLDAFDEAKVDFNKLLSALTEDFIHMTDLSEKLEKSQEWVDANLAMGNIKVNFKDGQPVVRKSSLRAAFADGDLRELQILKEDADGKSYKRSLRQGDNSTDNE